MAVSKIVKKCLSLLYGYSNIKIELVKMILNIENPSIVQKIVDLLKSETKDFSLAMTENEKKEIEEASVIIMG